MPFHAGSEVSSPLSLPLGHWIATHPEPQCRHRPDIQSQHAGGGNMIQGQGGGMGPGYGPPPGQNMAPDQGGYQYK